MIGCHLSGARLEVDVRTKEPKSVLARKLGKLARSPKATLLITAFVILSLHRAFEYFLSAVPRVSALLSWGAILAVAWVIAMQIIECVGYVVEAISELIVKVVRSVRRIGDYWRQE